MKVILGFFFDLFFGDDGDSSPNCEEWEVEDSVSLMSDDGEVELKPHGSYGTPLK